MEQNMTRQTEAIIKKHKRWKRWQKVVSMMACVVVFCTTYALILPAITMTRTAQVLSCPVAIHSHTAACYDSEHNLICGEADYVVHVHDESCYDEEGSCVCALPEIREHQHDSSCYRELSQLICTEEVNPGHVHGEECYTLSAPELICTDESEDHTHTEECYAMEKVLVCGMEEGEGSHNHTAECYRTSSLLDCEKKGVLHTHTDKCYDNSHKLTCGEIEVLQHVHADGCFETVKIEEPDEETEPTETEPAAETEPVEEPSPDETEPADDEVVGGTIDMDESVRASEGSFISEEIALPMADTDPIPVDVYVVSQSSDGKNKTQLLYKEGNGDWVTVGSGTTIPGDATLHLDIVYADVNIEQLIAHGGQLSYDVPGFMRNPTAQGTIMNGNTQVGTIVVENGKAIITFNQSFLQEQQDNNQTLLGGTFYIESAVDLSYIEDHEPGNLVIGDIEIKLDWEDEIIAKYGDATIDKSNAVYSQDEEGHPYVTYTLTVTAGEDGCPDVKVIDSFNSGSKPAQNVAEYVGVTGASQKITGIAAVTETGAPSGKEGSVYLGTVSTSNNQTTVTTAGENAQKPGTLVWEIGNMEPGEVRTLTYTVRLQDSYIGVQKKENLLNTATALSGGYTKDSDSTTFAPKAGMNERKTAAEPVKNDDGTYTITYTVWVKANNDNTYTLDNVKIYDSLNHPNNRTENKYLTSLAYDEDSFTLHNGGNANAPVVEAPENPHEGQGNPIFNEDTYGFTYYLGDMAPGEERTLTYDLTVSPEFFVEAGNGAGVIHNRALIYLDDTRKDTQTGHIQAYNCNRTLDAKKWDRKLPGSRITASETITMNGNVYELTGNCVSQIANPGSFTAPEGSYAYTVIVNETGDWNVSSASMADELENDCMHFLGYVRVDAFSVDQSSLPSGDDYAVEDYFADRTPVQTAWVKIDNLSSFEFKPSELGFNGTYAYRLTYYAQPVFPEDWDGTPIVVMNQFGLSGEVGIGDKVIIIETGITAQGGAVITDVSEMKVDKLGWYYDASSDKLNHQNGALYWVIRIDADTLKQGTMLADITEDISAPNDPAKKDQHRSYENATVGIYEGDFGHGEITDYATFEEALASGKLTESSAQIYIGWVPQQNYAYGAGEIMVVNDYNVPAGKSIYIIYTTAPDQKPTGKTELYSYKNSVCVYDGTLESLETPEGVAEINVSGNGGIAKLAGSIYTVKADGTFTRDVAGGVTGGGGHFGTDNIKSANGKIEPGTYVDWTVHINTDGTLDGQTVNVTDFIPDGMELSFIRTFTVHDGNRAYTVQNENLLADGWNEHSIVTWCNGISGQNMRIYYYDKDQQAKWRIQNLKGEIIFQVVCRVTDPDVLLGNESKTFTNTVRLDTEDGSRIDEDSADVEVTKRTMSKQSANSNNNGGRYPFVINVNSLGEDLVKNNDQLTVVDTLSDSLVMDVSTIVIKNTQTGAVLSSDRYKVSTEGQTVNITIPDNLPLEIRYDAIVQAAPGEIVSITNTAHWEGHDPGDSTTVEVRNYSYTAGGTVSTSDTPYIKIVKLDQYDISKKLPNARFKVTEVELVSGEFQPKTNGQVWDSDDMVTGADGTLTVGRESGKLMKWNTVYMVEEIAAPDGYVLDAQPHYFAVGKMENGTYPASLATYKDAGASIYYLGAEYTYTAYNHKYQATMVKTFQDSGNNSVKKIDGTYRFGIFEMITVNGQEVPTTSEPLEKGEIVIGKGVENTMLTFHNLDKDKTYRIYELDDQGRRIENNSAALAGSKMFDVTYTGGADGTNKVTFGDNAKTEITINNSVRYTELPQTGGMGTMAIYALGASLMVLSAAAFVLKHKIAY